MNNLPIEHTPFVGRDEELDNISRWLTTPDCRLITIVGVGGSGKTRLAIEVAKQNEEHFPDGIYFIPLQSLTSTDFIPSTVAATIGYMLRGADEHQQIIDVLREKEMLLIFDNFEHVLYAVDLLTAILNQCSGVKLIVTSRENLNTRDEWLYTIDGLRFPESDNHDNVGDYGAIALFCEYAQRVRRDFSLEHDLASVVKICQIVDGMPLALELATSWLRTLSCQAILEEVQQSIDFLDTNLRDIPSRHQSMRSVFDQSWRLLSDEEQRTFRRLSVFRGGFTRDAARQVAGASLPVLSALVDKSLLRFQSDERYQIHALLHQYASEQLQTSDEETTRTHQQHCTYYIAFLYHQRRDVSSSRQAEVIRAILADQENVRGALRYALENGRFDDLLKAMSTYLHFLDVQGYSQEAIQIHEKQLQVLTADSASDNPMLRAYTWNWLGWSYLRVGQLDKSQSAFDTSVDIFDEFNMQPTNEFVANPLCGRVLISTTRGNPEETIAMGQPAIEQLESMNDQQSLALLLYALANAYFSLGEYDRAREYALRSHKIAEAVDNIYRVGYILIVLGNIERALKHLDMAQHYYQSSYDIKKRIWDREGVAFALNHLGRVYWLQGYYQKAEEAFRQSLTLYRQIHDPGGLATALLGLSDTAQIYGRYQNAIDTLCQSLDIIKAIQWIPLTLVALASAGDLMQKIGQPERSIRLLSLVIHHPASDMELRERAQQGLESLQPDVPADTYAEAQASSQAMNLDEAASELYNDLRQWQAMQDTDDKSVIADGMMQMSSTLIDPLTVREQEILRLLADGLTNQEIADKLYVVLGTVKAHNHNIFSKLSVKNRVQAIQRAREIGLLDS